MGNLKEFNRNYKLLYLFYKKNNPRKIDDIEELLSKYKLTDLDRKLRYKYGVSPLKLKKKNYCHNCSCQSCLKIKYKYQQQQKKREKIANKSEKSTHTASYDKIILDQKSDSDVSNKCNCDICMKNRYQKYINEIKYKNQKCSSCQ